VRLLGQGLLEDGCGELDTRGFFVRLAGEESRRSDLFLEGGVTELPYRCASAFCLNRQLINCTLGYFQGLLLFTWMGASPIWLDLATGRYRFFASYKRFGIVFFVFCSGMHRKTELTSRFYDRI